MALGPEYALGRSEFNEFLFSYIGEEENGQPLTVLSALARLGFDPWKESARLSALAKKSAANELAAIIVSLATGDCQTSDCQTPDSQSIADRLVISLPRHRAAPDVSAEQISDSKTIPNVNGAKWLTWTVVAAAVVIALSWLRGE
jgi:hypothetical protein